MNNYLLSAVDSDAFNNFTRIPSNVLLQRLNCIKDISEKQPTLWRQSLSASLKLAVTLRYLVLVKPQVTGVQLLCEAERRQEYSDGCCGIPQTLTGYSSKVCKIGTWRAAFSWKDVDHVWGINSDQ